MIVVQTPLRVSFLGGGTDFEDFYRQEEGCVLSSAIDKYVFVIVKERFDDKIYVNYSRKEIAESVDEVKHDLVREAMRITGVERGIEITTLADVPSEGTGLGSSSSITVGLLQALYAYQGETKSAAALSEDACRIEIDILKRPIGKQDQYIASFGNLRFIRFNHGGQQDVEMKRVALHEKMLQRLNRSLLLFFTGVTRDSGTILTEQKQNIEEQRQTLSHMAFLAREAKRCLEAGAFDEFGDLMHQGWEYKKLLASKITNGVIDEMYQAARKAGAIGGKITGAGGGGFLLLCCRPEKQDDVRLALGHLRELPFRVERDGSKVIFNYRR